MEILRGDLRDPAAVRKAIAGRDLVFHVAGFISYWVLDSGIMEDVNVGGVKAIVDACLEFKVKRLIHVSSVGAVGFHPDGSPADEDTPFNWPESFGYMTTKRDGQKIGTGRRSRARASTRSSSIPHRSWVPATPLPGTAHNRLYADMYAKRFFFGTFGGGLAVVDVRDLVETILAAAEKGGKGQAYLSVGANVPYTRVLELMATERGQALHSLRRCLLRPRGRGLGGRDPLAPDAQAPADNRRLR